MKETFKNNDGEQKPDGVGLDFFSWYNHGLLNLSPWYNFLLLPNQYANYTRV